MRVDPRTVGRFHLAPVRSAALAIAIVCAPSSGITSLAQAPASSTASAEQVDAWLQSAERLLRDRQRSDAQPFFERALEAARRLGLEAQEAQALCALGEIEIARARYAAAREHGEKSAAIYERLAARAEPASAAITAGIGRVNVTLSIVAEREGNLAEARSRGERAVAAFGAAGDRRGRGVATLNLLRISDSNVEVERELNDRVIADARAVSDRGLEASALHSFGDHLFNHGHYAESLAKLESAAAIFQSLDRQVDLGTVYNSLGRLYRAHGRFDAALASQLKALALHEKSNAPFTHLQSLNAVAVTYNVVGDSRQARIYFERALALADKSGSTARIQDFLRANFAGVLLQDGDYRQAAEVLEGVVARGLDRFPTMRMRDLSYALLKMGRPEAAMAWAEKAIGACGERENLNCIHALERRADAHAALGNGDAALADLQGAMATIEIIRSRLVPGDFFKQQFHLAQEDLFSRTIALQIRRGQTADALETAERARSRAFLDLLASRDLPLFPGRAPEQASPSPAASDRDALPLVFRGAPGPAREGGSTTGGDLLSNTVVRPPSSQELVATAGRLRSTLIAYWVADDRVFIWVASPNGQLRSSQAEVRLSTLRELIRSTTPFADSDRPTGTGQRQAGLTTRGAASIAISPNADRAWRELHALLIKPVRDALPRAVGARLTIIPHGPLAALAFAGLQDERGRYLLEDYTLHYAPSAGALQFTAAARRADSRRGSVLMVADPTPPALSTLDRPLPRLPGARAESRAIAALIPRTRLTRLEGDGASETTIQASAGGKMVLHFATHAIVRDDDPFSSFLALARSGTADGLLTAQEIYRLRLDADLVVLSACRSAGGRVTGDGIATFARAFIYAGAPSIIASLWDVADEPTNRLLPEFYRGWLRGMSKAQGLRAAQLQLLKELRAGRVQIKTPAGLVTLPEHPVFWAGFSLIGEPD